MSVIMAPKSSSTFDNILSSAGDIAMFIPGGQAIGIGLKAASAIDNAAKGNYGAALSNVAGGVKAAKNNGLIGQASQPTTTNVSTAEPFNSGTTQYGNNYGPFTRAVNTLTNNSNDDNWWKQYTRNTQ